MKNHHSRWSLFLIATMFVVQLAPIHTAWAAPVANSSSLHLSARSAIMIDAENGKVLYSKKADVKRTPASTTKLITALVLLDHKKLNQTMRVPASARNVPRKGLGVHAGEIFTVRELLHALLVSSANDVAHTIAVNISGSDAKFALLMNKKAKEVGANHTRFANPHGLPLPSNQYTTAHDLALIMKAVYKNRLLMSVLKTKTMKIESSAGRVYYLRSTNKMLWRTPGRMHGKTGFTRSALYCFVGRLRTNTGRDVIVTILGSMKPWNDLQIMANRTGSGNWLLLRYNQVNLSKNQTVKLQKALGKAGIPMGQADGIFGPVTLNAVKHFQRSNGLSPDGLVGPQTLAKLRAYGFS